MSSIGDNTIGVHRNLLQVLYNFLALNIFIPESSKIIVLPIICVSTLLVLDDAFPKADVTLRII